MESLSRTPMLPKKTDKILLTANSRQSMAASSQNESDREYTDTANMLGGGHTKRKSHRTRTNGIVALINFAKPVVTKIYDISPEGVSFLYAGEIDIAEDVLHMEILIFNNLTNFEYLINQIKGHVKSKNLVADPKSKTTSWRYSVEFVDLTREQLNRLKTFFNRVPQIKDLVSDNCHLKASYDF